jgi:hypothetical protein
MREIGGKLIHFYSVSFIPLEHSSTQTRVEFTIRLSLFKLVVLSYEFVYF